MLFSWSVRTLYRHLLIMQFSEGSKLIPDYYHVIFEWTIKTLSIKLIFSNQILILINILKCFITRKEF